MVFKGPPGEHVVLRPKQKDKVKKVRQVGVFDANGLLAVTEPFLIERMLAAFEALPGGESIKTKKRKGT